MVDCHYVPKCLNQGLSMRAGSGILSFISAVYQEYVILATQSTPRLLNL